MTYAPEAPDPITTGAQAEIARLTSALGGILQTYSVSGIRLDQPNVLHPTASAVLLLLDKALRQLRDGDRALAATTLIKAHQTAQNLRDTLRVES